MEKWHVSVLAGMRINLFKWIMNLWKRLQKRGMTNVKGLLCSPLPLFFPVVYVFSSAIIKWVEGHINASSNVNDQVLRRAPDTELPWERDFNL